MYYLFVITCHVNSRGVYDHTKGFLTELFGCQNLHLSPVTSVRNLSLIHVLFATIFWSLFLMSEFCQNVFRQYGSIKIACMISHTYQIPLYDQSCSCQNLLYGWLDPCYNPCMVSQAPVRTPSMVRPLSEPPVWFDHCQNSQYGSTTVRTPSMVRPLSEPQYGSTTVRTPSMV